MTARGDDVAFTLDHDLARNQCGTGSNRVVPLTTTVSRNMQRAKTSHDLVSGSASHNIGPSANSPIA
jgi:hypothetical protein